MNCLFPPVDRHDLRPAPYGEGHYSYLQRTARSDFAHVREVLEEWFSRYPRAHRNELRRRFESGDDRNFRSAFFELYLHELLLVLGCHLLVHPRTSSSRSTTPDFLVTTRGGLEFYLEATEASEKTETELAGEARVNQVYDVVNRLECRDFFIGVEHHGLPDTPPPAGKIRSFLERKVADLDLKELRAEMSSSGLGLRGLPRWPFKWENWEVKFFPVPKSHTAVDSGMDQPLGLFFPRMGRRTNPQDPLRKKLQMKRSRYGKLDKPLMIAINGFDLLLGRSVVLDVLLGAEGSTIAMADSNGVPRELPVLDGFWYGPRGPRNSEIFAVLAVFSILPWTVGAEQHEPSVYYHPWARDNLATELDELNSVTVEGHEIRSRRGIRVRDLLRLTDEFPGS